MIPSIRRLSTSTSTLSPTEGSVRKNGKRLSQLWQWSRVKLQRIGWFVRTMIWGEISNGQGLSARPEPPRQIHRLRKAEGLVASTGQSLENLRSGISSDRHFLGFEIRFSRQRRSQRRVSRSPTSGGIDRRFRDALVFFADKRGSKEDAASSFAAAFLAYSAGQGSP